MKKTIIITILFLSSIGLSNAQTIWALSYEPATPLGDMTKFIGKTTLRGLNGSANWFITNKISAGVSIQWTGFYEKNERETWSVPGGALTATAWKEFYLWGLYANGKYQFKDVEEEGRFVPYIGLNLGTMYIDQNIQIGTYTEQEKSWKFALAPEVGARIPMGIEQSWGFNVMLRYQVAFYNFEGKYDVENDIGMLQFINYSVGVYWKMWPRGERY